MELTKNNEQVKQGYLYAVRLLTASKKSAKELSKRLLEKGYAEESVVQIIENLKKQGVLNDLKLVEDSIQWAKRGKKFGKKRISFELKKRGIATGDISQALENYSEVEEKENAEELAQSKWEKSAKLEVRKRKKKVYDFLISRGFDFELSRQIVNNLGRNENI